MNEFRSLRVLWAALAVVLIVVVPGAPGRAADDVSEQRRVPAFDRIRLAGAFTAEITAGVRVPQVVVSAGRDTIGRVTTEVRDHTLIVGMRPGTNVLGRAPKLTVALPVLVAFSNEGASSAHIAGLTGSDVEITNEGAASVVASGRAARETITLDGTGKIDTTAVEAHDVTVDNNGFGHIMVRASGVLIMNVNGVGKISYTGEPTRVESHVNGIGSIRRL